MCHPERSRGILARVTVLHAFRSCQQDSSPSVRNDKQKIVTLLIKRSCMQCFGLHHCVGGRLRAPPAADAASKKEWPRSKFGERMQTTNFGHRNRSDFLTPVRKSPKNRRRGGCCTSCLSLPLRYRWREVGMKPPSPANPSRLSLRVVVTTL